MLSGGGRGSSALDEEGGIIKALEHENSKKRKEVGKVKEGKTFFLECQGGKDLARPSMTDLRSGLDVIGLTCTNNFCCSCLIC